MKKVPENRIISLSESASAKPQEAAAVYKVSG